MDRSRQNSPVRTTSTLALLIVVGAGLYVAREILIPVALALLVTFLFAPLVRRIERLRIPRVVAVALVLGVGVGGLGALGWLLEKEAFQIASRLPEYKANILRKLEAVRLTHGSVLDKASKTIAELGQEMGVPEADKDARRSAGLGSPGGEPISVKVAGTPSSAFDSARSLIGPTIRPASTAVIVVVLMVRPYGLFGRKSAH